MKRMRSKFALLLTLALLLAPCQGTTPEHTAKAADATSETLRGEGWWNHAQTGRDYAINGDGSYLFKVNALEGFTGTATADDGITYEYDDFCAFSVEAYTGDWYFTTNTDKNGWYAGSALDHGETIDGIEFQEFYSSARVGTATLVKVEREGDTLSISYENSVDSYQITGTNSSTPQDLNLHFIAHAGTIEVNLLSVGFSDDPDSPEEDPDELDSPKEEEDPTNDGKTSSTVSSPGKCSSLSAKNNKKKTVRLCWKKVGGANGYQIQYALKKNMKKAKSRTVKKSPVDIKKLKKNKTYYFRVRAYRLNNGERIYGKWCSKKKVKVKK